MAGKSVSFNTSCNLSESYVEELAKWLSCNGEVCGVGPTALFAAAAALFLHHELQATVLVPGDHPHVSLLEKTLLSAMVLGTLALMVHVWVCAMRFFQYYLDTLIRDSPNVLLEMTTAGLLGASQPELAALGPLTRFLRQQQPQIHITVCWLLALCYADYIRKHYCTRFNMPYLEQWQAELHATAERRARGALSAVHSFAGAVRTRLRGLAPPPPTSEAHTVAHRATSALRGVSASATVMTRREVGSGEGARQKCSSTTRLAAPPPRRPCRSLEHTSRPRAAPAAVRRMHQALTKLRAYIKATRCSCGGAADAGACVAARSPAASPALGLVAAAAAAGLSAPCSRTRCADAAAAAAAAAAGLSAPCSRTRCDDAGAGAGVTVLHAASSAQVCPRAGSAPALSAERAAVERRHSYSM